MKRVIWCIVGREGGQLTVNGVSCRGSRKSRHLNKTASGKIPLKPSEACFPAVEQVGIVHCMAALSALWEPGSKKVLFLSPTPKSATSLVPQSHLQGRQVGEAEGEHLDVQDLCSSKAWRVSGGCPLRHSPDPRLTFGKEREHSRTATE